MDVTGERPSCVARVSSGSSWGRSRSCQNLRGLTQRTVVVIGRPATRYDEGAFEFVEGTPTRQTVMRWFCATHDPERVKDREEKQRAARAKERDRTDKLCASARDLCVRLGCGHVHFGPNGVTGSVILERHDVEKILKELGR